MVNKYVVTVCCLLVFWVESGCASDFDTSINQVKEMYQVGDLKQAAMKLKESSLLLWREIPLTVVNVRLVKDLKDYQDRGSNIYKGDEPVRMTVQVIGQGIKEAGGSFLTDIEADFTVLAEDGSVLGGAEKVLKYKRITPIPMTDVALNLTYSIGGTIPGAYIIQTTVRDITTRKEVSFKQTVVFQ